MVLGICLWFNGECGGGLEGKNWGVFFFEVLWSWVLFEWFFMVCRVFWWSIGVDLGVGRVVSLGGWFRWFIIMDLVFLLGGSFFLLVSRLLYNLGESIFCWYFLIGLLKRLFSLVKLLLEFVYDWVDFVFLWIFLFFRINMLR